MTSRWLRLTLFGAVALAALSGGIWLRLSHTTAPPTPQAAAAIRALVLPDIEGKSQNFQQWQGKVVVVNFWATWCGPCREEIPMFVTLQRELGDKGLQFVGIAIDDAAKVREFSANYKINYPTLLGTFDTFVISEQAGNKLRGLPYTLILDRTGAIVATETGGLKRERLQALLTPLL
jgi:thiol-disulfide isomerase/thioredoxin